MGAPDVSKSGNVEGLRVQAAVLLEEQVPGRVLHARPDVGDLAERGVVQAAQQDAAIRG